MKTLKRNQITFHYKNFVTSTPVQEEGYYTGESEITYGDLTECEAYMTPATGIATETMFGQNINYDNILIMEKCPFNEHSILWIKALTSSDNDYVVEKIAESLNSVSVAIRKVTRNG